MTTTTTTTPLQLEFESINGGNGPHHGPSTFAVTSLVAFFRSESGVSEPFTEAFLGGANLRRIQNELTVKMRQVTGNGTLPVVEFSDGILDGLMTMAYMYRLALLNVETLWYANLSFVESMIPSMEARYHESAAWNRWTAQGIPDPNNIPLPLPRDSTDFTAETDVYMLSDPWGKPRPMW